MWKGKITIGNAKVDVEVFESKMGGFKEWHGNGSTPNINLIDIGEHKTELGVIIVNHIDLFSGNFTFVGSGKPLINL